VTPAGAALAEAKNFARAIVARSAATIAFGKSAFYRQIEAPLGEAYRIAGQSMVKNLAHPDSAEGIAAFLEKRPAKWEGV
jgi:enoyl-CoA hydratase/carnithine racemase